MSFFTQKDLPSSKKPEILHENMTTNWQKFTLREHPAPQKTKILDKHKNPPKIGDFEIYVPQPQLHQTFKPIKKFPYTLLLI